MIHPNILQPKLHPDIVISQVGRELNQLIPEVLYKLVVDVRYPCLQPDRHVLEQKVDALLLLKDGLELDELVEF